MWGAEAQRRKRGRKRQPGDCEAAQEKVIDVSKKIAATKKKFREELEALEAEAAKTIDEANAEMLDRWALDPVLCVREAFGLNGVAGDLDNPGLTCQQEDGLTKLGKLVNAKIKLAEGGKLTKEEADYASKIGISIMSGQGTGKDGFAALAILWFLLCFPHPKVPCTAPNAAQLQSVLWSEISKWLNRRDKSGEPCCLPQVRDAFTIQSTKVFRNDLEDKSEIGKRWFAEARTVNLNQNEEKQAETMAGRHEDYMMYVIDEASGVPDAVRRPFEGGLTGVCNFILEIFNPTHRSGFAFRTHFGKASETKQWVRLHWDAEESELVPKEHVEAIAAKHGRKSNFFLIRVKGLPPQSDEDTLIPDNWVYAAQQRNLDPMPTDAVFIGVDCAMGGGDEAVLTAVKGPKVIAKETYAKTEKTQELGTHVVSFANEHEADLIFIDSIGVGRGVYDFVCLFFPPHKVVGVDVREAARDGTRFYRLRDELWWKMRTAFEKNLIDIPEDDGELRSQLSSVKYERAVQHLGNVIKVESKAQMKKRQKGSPDHADSLMLTFVRDITALRVDKEMDAYEEEEPEEMDVEHAWMMS